MLKIHFTLCGKSNSDYLLICQKRNSIISYIVHIWLTCNVEIFVVDNFHRLSSFEPIGRSLFWLYNKNSWYNVDIFKYSLKCYKRFYSLFWSHLQLCNWYLLLVNNYLFFILSSTCLTWRLVQNDKNRRTCITKNVSTKVLFRAEELEYEYENICRSTICLSLCFRCIISILP